MSTGPDPHRTAFPVRVPGGARGFTLIEVVAAMTILVLMAGTVFAIVSGATRAAAETEFIQRENRQMRAFIGHCRDVFARMPAGATVELKIIENSPLLQELVVRGAPEGFVMGPEAAHEVPEFTLAFRRREADKDAEGSPLSSERYYLGLSTPNFYRPVPENSAVPPRSPIRRREGTPFIKPDREGRFWMELLPDLRQATWRFYDPGKKRWEDKGGAGRPPMIELTLVGRGRTVPLRAVFEIGG